MPNLGLWGVIYGTILHKTCYKIIYIFDLDEQYRWLVHSKVSNEVVIFAAPVRVLQKSDKEHRDFGEILVIFRF